MRTETERNLEIVPTVVADTTSDEDTSDRHIAIAIPGIRTDGTWVDSASTRVKRWERPIEILKVGPELISTWNLFSRIGTERIKSKIRADVQNIVIKYGESHSISVICHSMGAALFAEILNDVDYKFDKIILLGSVCHRQHALTISKNCNYFMNQCGTQDRWPIIAEAVNWIKYSATGTVGFKRHYSNDTFFDNDHATCTEQPHMDSYVIPLLYGLKLEIPTDVTYKYSSSDIIYWRMGIYLSIFCLCFLIYVLALSFL